MLSNNLSSQPQQGKETEKKKTLNIVFPFGGGGEAWGEGEKQKEREHLQRLHAQCIARCRVWSQNPEIIKTAFFLDKIARS